MGKLNREKVPVEKFFTFDKLALVIGFIVDTITLVSILVSIKLSNGNFELPNYINPWLAFSIWILGSYIYLALLHSYWQQNTEKKLFQKSFGKFIFKDLLFGFRNPFLSLLGLVSIITLFWIASFEQGIFILFAAVGYVTFITVMVSGMASIGEVAVDEDRKQMINDNWEFLKKRLKSRLTRKQWLSFSDLEDIAILWGIDNDDMVYALAKYASENSPQTTFGKIYSREDDEIISGDYPVLINLKNVNREEYYYTG